MNKRLEEARVYLGLSKTQIADELGLKIHNIRDMETGKQKIGAEIATLIEEKFSINGWWLLTGKGKMTESEAQASPKLTNVSMTDSNLAINGTININTSAFNHSEDIKEIVELLQFAPSGFLTIIKTKLNQFKELSQL